LDTNPLFFHVVSKLVQTRILTYDEIFQALVVDGDILLLKPFLDPSHPLYSSDLVPLEFHVFGKLKKHVRGWKFPSYDSAKAEVQKCFLDLGFDAIIRWKFPASDMVFFSFFQMPESPKGLSQCCTVGGMGSGNGFRRRMFPSTTRA
jgi:hypothetical protein